MDDAGDSVARKVEISWFDLEGTETCISWLGKMVEGRVMWYLRGPMLDLHAHCYKKDRFSCCDFLKRNEAVLDRVLVDLGTRLDNEIIRSRRAKRARGEAHSDDFVITTKGLVTFLAWFGLSRRAAIDRDTASRLLRAFVYKTFPSRWDIRALCAGVLDMGKHNCEDGRDGSGRCKHIREFQVAISSYIEVGTAQEQVVQIILELQRFEGTGCLAIKLARMEFNDEVCGITDEVEPETLQSLCVSRMSGL